MLPLAAPDHDAGTENGSVSQVLHFKRRSSGHELSDEYMPVQTCSKAKIRMNLALLNIVH